MARALAIHAVLADEHQSIGQQIERDGEPPAGNTHHELVFFELFATLFVYAHNFSLRAMLNKAILAMTPESEWTTRLVVGRYPDRQFDIDFWQKQGDEAIFSAAWEMIELAEEMKHGRKPELQRTVTTLKRLPG